MLQVAVVGDFDPNAVTHLATNDALQHAADAIGTAVDVEWIATEAIRSDDVLGGFDAFVIAPGSPYRNQQGAIDAIRFARTNGVPLLGTCGGFQHVVLEYARNVLGFEDAEHAEYES